MFLKMNCNCSMNWLSIPVLACAHICWNFQCFLYPSDVCEGTCSSFQRVLRSSMCSRLAGDSWMSCRPKVDANWFMCATSSLIGAISSWNSYHTNTHRFFIILHLLQDGQEPQTGLQIRFSIVSHPQCSNSGKTHASIM